MVSRMHVILHEPAFLLAFIKRLSNRKKKKGKKTENEKKNSVNNHKIILNMKVYLGFCLIFYL
jgi:hypothetical protein